MLTCENASRLISEGQERQLSLKERMNLRLHLFMCTSCRRFERQLARVREIMRNESSQDSLENSVPLPDEAQERIRQALKSHGK